MQGDPKVMEELNRLLANELTAIDQYFIHSRMFDDWGYSKLHERISHEMAHETEHASRLIERILMLSGVPDMSQREPLQIGSDVVEMLRSDLELELKVAKDLKAAIVICENSQDFQTRRILEQLLADTEEDHAHWLEQQLGLVASLGMENYLQAQL